MSSSVVAALVGLAGVVVGGSMTAVTAWWQSSIARKDRLTELQVQLRHERFLRDEALQRTAMLELAYAYRRFSNGCWEAIRHHEHNQMISSQKGSPAIADLIKLAQTALDLFDKHSSLLDEATLYELELARDRWSDVYISEIHIQNRSYLERVGEVCCAFGGDLELLDWEVQEAARALEGQIGSMRVN
jgi:hypothetical protein